MKNRILETDLSNWMSKLANIIYKKRDVGLFSTMSQIEITIDGVVSNYIYSGKNAASDRDEDYELMTNLIKMTIF